MMLADDKRLTSTEVAEMVGLSARHCARLAEQGRLPGRLEKAYSGSQPMIWRFDLRAMEARPKKTCRKCGSLYDREFGFHTRQSSPDGKQYWCKGCMDDAVKESQAGRPADSVLTEGERRLANDWEVHERNTRRYLEHKKDPRKCQVCNATMASDRPKRKVCSPCLDAKQREAEQKKQKSNRARRTAA